MVHFVKCRFTCLLLLIGIHLCAHLLGGVACMVTLLLLGDNSKIDETVMPSPDSGTITDSEGGIVLASLFLWRW
jgi:hypothetical protein